MRWTHGMVGAVIGTIAGYPGRGRDLGRHGEDHGHGESHG